MINLYKLVPRLAADMNDEGIKRLRIGESAEMLLFLWDDKFVTSARKNSVPTAM